jgi:hypothetical protein
VNPRMDDEEMNRRMHDYGEGEARQGAEKRWRENIERVVRRKDRHTGEEG